MGFYFDEFKDFAKRNRDPIIIMSASITVGFLIRKYYHGAHYGSPSNIGLTSNQLQTLLNDPTAALTVELPCGARFRIFQMYKLQ